MTKRSNLYKYTPGKLPEFIGPEYPKLGAAVEALRDAVPYDAKAHGAAVEKAIRSLQRSELMACCKGPPLLHNEPIGDARREWLRGKLARCPGMVRRAREPHVWQRMYDEAMKEKHENIFGPVISKPKRVVKSYRVPYVRSA